MEHIVALSGSYSSEPHIVVKGFANKEFMPDLIRISAELKESGKSPVEAKQKIDTRSAATIRLAGACGIEQEDLSATRFDVSDYPWIAEGNEPPNYSVSRKVTLTLRDISNFERLIQGLTEIPVARIEEV